MICFDKNAIFALLLQLAVFTSMTMNDRVVAQHAKSDEAKADEVKKLVDLYDAAVQEIRSTPFSSEREREDFYKTWLDRLLNVIAKNPKSPYLSLACGNALGLSNSLGLYDRSRAILKMMVKQKKEPEWQLRWLTELGEIASKEYRVKGLESDWNEAVQALETAEKIGAALTAPDLKASAGTVERYILCLTYLADTFAVHGKDHLRAASLYYKANTQLQRMNAKEAKRLTSVGYDTEYFIKSEMVEYSHGGDEKHSEDALRRLVKMAREGKTHWPASYYVFEFASAQDPKMGNRFRGLVLKWLKTEPEDTWTPFLRFHLAQSYYRNKKYKEALPIHILLREKDKHALLAADVDALRQGSGGYYAEVLGNLIAIYLSLGQSDRVSELLEELRSLVPNDDRIKAFKISNHAGSSAPSPRKNNYATHLKRSRFMTVMMANLGFALASLTVFLFLKRIRKANRSVH